MFSYFWCSYHLKASKNIYWSVLLLVLLFPNTLKSTLLLQVFQLYWCRVVFAVYFLWTWVSNSWKKWEKVRPLGCRFCPLQFVQVILNGLVHFDISYVHGKAISKHKFLFLRRAACKYWLTEEKPGKLTVQGCADTGMSYPVCWLPECSYNSFTEGRKSLVYINAYNIK